MANKLFDPFLKRREAQSALDELERGMQQSRQEREQEQEQQKKLQRFRKWLDFKKRAEALQEIEFGPLRRAKLKALLLESELKYTDGNPHKMKMRAKRRSANRVAKQSRKRNRVHH